ncbi:MAG: valine--tRNA ligase [Oscillospiraceae bacterium]
MKQLEKIYDPKEVEDKAYQNWLRKGYFHAVVNKDKKPFTIMMPPPNITAQLHIGHALDCTIQDILIRFKRMKGYEALWLPGTDHAAIATEAKIVEAMAKEGIKKEDLGRDKFLEKAWEWNKKYGGRIIEQQKKIGSSCDWDRSRFTMDETCSKAVGKVFTSLYEKGLIYKGERIINWCPHCKTSISDAEVEYEEQNGHFWHIKYPVKDSDEFVEIATTRPETLLGDTAVAVNPNDERYKHLVGKTLILPLVGREIPVVADSYVDMDFGTGCVKIAPAHDPNDFEVGLRHKLPVINIMNEDASINELGGKYCGLDRYEARKQIIDDLEKEGLLVKTVEHTHNVGSCYRCHSTIEPWASRQWFVKMDTLAKPANDCVRNGDIQFIPKRMDKIYFNWMDNIKDWCISRQLWWGHRIPAWYCRECGEMVVSVDEVHSCPKCGSHKMEQDPDTLDTWFSSALWTFSTLGWPDKTPELEYFHPTDVLVTGYDIIFFWVARMIFSSLEHTGQIPFSTVFFHGLIRDSQGRKMSKSLGNGIDPIEIIDKYGADTLRLTLATGNTPGNDMRYSDEKLISCRNFANKLWNAARFVLMNLPEDKEIACELPETLTAEDKWVISKYNCAVRDVTENIEKFELGLAVQKVYDFIWDVYCDWYIELTKTRLNADEETAMNARKVLVYVLSNTLKLLHPFMPFITEEIWLALPHDGESIMISQFPEYDEKLNFAIEEQEFERVMTAIKGIRNVRAEMNVPPSKKASLFIETEHKTYFENAKTFFEKLASADEVKIGDKFDIDGAVQVVADGAKILIPMAQLIDKDKEIARLTKEKETCEKDIAFLAGKLGNEGFVAKAPEKVIVMEKEKLQKAEDKLAKILESIKSLD